jgi:hypothetical protein
LNKDKDWRARYRRRPAGPQPTGRE